MLIFSADLVRKWLENGQNGRSASNILTILAR
jgi:hypothetical protein